MKSYTMKCRGTTFSPRHISRSLGYLVRTPPNLSADPPSRTQTLVRLRAINKSAISLTVLADLVLEELRLRRGLAREEAADALSSPLLEGGESTVLAASDSGALTIRVMLSPSSCSTSIELYWSCSCTTVPLNSGRRISAFRSPAERWCLSSTPCSNPDFIFGRRRGNTEYSPTTSSSTAMASPKASTQRSWTLSSRSYARLAPSYTHLRVETGVMLGPIEVT